MSPAATANTDFGGCGGGGVPSGISPRIRAVVGTATGAAVESAASRSCDWTDATKAIGGRVRGAAQWATRHKQAPGTATLKTGNKPAVTLVNKLDYIDQVTTHTGINIALRAAAGRLRKALAISLRITNKQTYAGMTRAG